MPSADRRWFALAAALAIVVILSAPVAQQAFSAIDAGWPSQFRHLTTTAIAVPIAAAFLFAVVRIRTSRPMRLAALSASAAIGAAYALGSEILLSEAFHFVEYGLVAVLFYRAWRPLDDGRAVVLPVLATVLAGIADEWFQWFVPFRVGEARDVALNGVAAVCGVLYAAAVDPPRELRLATGAVARATLARWAAATLIGFAIFFQTVHVGYEVADPEIGTFPSRYTADELALAARERAARWREQPPLVVSRFSREDHYLAEALWRIQRRNQAWSNGDFGSAWRENRILEKFYAPVLDTPSYGGPSGHRWPAEQRADAEARAGSVAGALTGAEYAYPLYVWPGGQPSTLLLLKLLLVPGLVGAVTLAVRRWGPALGGWLAGLPVVAGPVLVFYAIEQGNAFAAQAAAATLAGLMATVAFCIAYARTCTRLRWYGCVALGWTVFAAAIALLNQGQLALPLALVGLVSAAALARRLLPRLDPVTSPSTIPPGDLALRLAATGTLVVVLTGLADELGPGLSGLLNAFPILTTIVAAFTHAQRGSAAVVEFLRGYLHAVVGFALFCVVMALTLTTLRLPLAVSAALVVQLTVHGVLLMRLRERQSSARRVRSAGPALRT